MRFGASRRKILMATGATPRFLLSRPPVPPLLLAALWRVHDRWLGKGGRLTVCRRHGLMAAMAHSVCCHVSLIASDTPCVSNGSHGTLCRPSIPKSLTADAAPPRIPTAPAPPHSRPTQPTHPAKKKAAYHTSSIHLRLQVGVGQHGRKKGSLRPLTSPAALCPCVSKSRSLGGRRRL